MSTLQVIPWGMFQSRLLSLCLCWLIHVLHSVATSQAQESIETGMPGLPIVNRDQTIKSPVDFFGFKIGSRHVRHDQVTAYLRYLAASSKRTKLIEYGRTQGGRPLMVLAVSSPENIRRLDEIRINRRKLSSGLIKGIPTDTVLVMFMGYCVHGDEASAVNSAPIVAYDLVASKSPRTIESLEKAVFFIDPALNPDGVDRFANWVNENRGQFPSSSPNDREHQAPWPGGRTSYYWFDLNRDWLPLTHPESQGRMRLFHEWKPNVVLDYHEMGPTNTYFFQPGVPKRNNPLAPAANLQLTRQFAKRFATELDQAGELYFTEEVFDDFYIGKGSTYPDLNGAVGILFEQGSTAGLRLKNSRTNRHFSETIANQVRTSLASIDRLIELRKPLLEFQTNFFRDALRSGKQSSTTAFVLTGSPSRIKAAKTLLNQHRIRCRINGQTIRIEGELHATGKALIIPAAQSQFVLLDSLMQTDQEFEENVFYDVSAWHLPSAFDLKMHRLQTDIPSHWMSDDTAPDQPSPPDREAPAPNQILGVAFSPVELESPQWVSSLMQMGAEVRVSMVPFEGAQSFNRKSVDQQPPTSQNEPLPAGTFVVLKSSNRARWPAIQRKINQLSTQSTVSVRWLTSGRIESGPDLGSNQIVILPPCNPALIAGKGTNANSAGAIWFFLDHRMRQPSTRIEASQIKMLDLHSYSCLILPSGNYQDWDRAEASLLKDYVTRGGTLIATGDAIDWLKRNGVLKPDSPSIPGGSIAASTRQIEDGIPVLEKVVEVDMEGSQGKAKSKKPGVEGSTSEPPPFADAQTAAALESIAGAFFLTKIDPTHPLAFGFPDELVPVFRDSDQVFEMPANPFQTAAKYVDVIAGYVSPRNRSRLLGTTAVWASSIGKGRVILMADLPVFRGYVRSSERFLTNAILLGPILQIPEKPE